MFNKERGYLWDKCSKIVCDMLECDVITFIKWANGTGRFTFEKGDVAVVYAFMGYAYALDQL